MLEMSHEEKLWLDRIFNQTDARCMLGRSWVTYRILIGPLRYGNLTIPSKYVVLREPLDGNPHPQP